MTGLAMDTHPRTAAADARGNASAEVARRLSAVSGRIEDAARAAGRDPADVTLVAVSKTWGMDEITAAAEAGQRDFGESRAQELRDKVADADGRLPADVRWHFVGRLQTNKVKYVVGTCALVHSVDRWDLVEALAARAASEDTEQQMLVQVNVDDDPAKAGLAPADLPAFLDRLGGVGTLRCTGLMTLPAFDADPAPAFARLYRLREEARREHPDVVHLSMGMSRDFETAIGQGATIVRVGEAIFGPRRHR